MTYSDNTSGNRSRWLSAMLALALLLPLTVSAQNSAATGDTATEAEEFDTSQHVDESEENYRARMELRDQRYRDTPRMNTTYAPSSGTEIIDGLPLASQQHIKAQLRNMIIESRQWEPGEDLTDYPYEPSADAQTNTPLRNKEREAWVEQLQKFQDREAAAYANSEGGQQGSSPQGQSKQGERGQENSEQSAAEQSSQLASENSRSASKGSTREPSPSTAGVSESALSFLQGNNGSGGPLDDGDAESGDQEGTGKMDAALAASQAGSQGDKESGEETGSEAAVVPGTLAIGDLVMLQGLGQQGSATQPSGSLEMGQSAESRSEQAELQMRQEGAAQPQPGTINLNDLQNLDQMGMQVGGQPSSASAAANPAPQISSHASVNLSSSDQTSSASDSEPQPQEISETELEIVIEPGTIDIAELELLDGN